jgi:hypothetical protein
VVRHHKRRHRRLIHSHPEPVTRHTRLANLKECPANSVTVANADLIVIQAFDREVLAELSVREIVATQLVFPIAIRVQLVRHHRSVHAAMPTQIALPIAFDIQAPNQPAAINRLFPDSRVNRLTSPRHITRKANID